MCITINRKKKLRHMKWMGVVGEDDENSVEERDLYEKI